MAVEGEEVDYESDPEDALDPLAMRRRKASDDEAAEGSDGRGKPGRRDLRAGVGSDVESDDQGGAPGYEDEEESDPEEEEEEFEEEAEEEVEDEVALKDRANGEEGDDRAPGVDGVQAVVDPGSGGDGRRFGGEPVEHQGENQEDKVEEEKEENEPFAVPTAGAFYMHDDRFRENGRGRRRRMPGARKSWESKDDRAWVHDRFEEMNLQDARYDEERRTSKGRLRAHGSSRNRVTDRGYARGNRSQSYDDSNNQNRAPRSMRGRGPRRYEPLPKNKSEIPAAHNKQYTKSHESTSSTSAGRQSSHTSNVQTEQGLHHKHVFASSLSSASPPFYPSGSSNKDISVSQKKDAQTRTISKTISSPMHVGDNFSTSKSGSLLRGKSLVDSVGHDRGYTNDSIPLITGKSSSSSQLQSSGSYLSSSSQTQSHSRFQGRGLSVTEPMIHQSTTPLSQITPVSAQTQTPITQQKPTHFPVQGSLRTASQKMDHRSGSGTRALSPPQALSANSSDVGETGYAPLASKSNLPLVGKGKISNQGGSGRGSFLYGGAAQVLGATGAMGIAHGDQNFPGTPALLPVMQFGGQHHGGLGFPAVGMALPGYVAQPQLGFGNSEMTWVPMLAGAAGALGTQYPYIALDSSFYARSSGQTSASTSSSGDTGTTKPASTWKSPQELESVNDEFGQRQNKPRRYSEMNFGQ